MLGGRYYNYYRSVTLVVKTLMEDITIITSGFFDWINIKVNLRRHPNSLDILVINLLYHIPLQDHKYQNSLVEKLSQH